MPLPPVIFEDEVIVAFNKPASLPIVAGRGAPRGENLLTLVQQRCGESVVNVHRIDSEASGVFLCTKTKAAQDFVSGQFQSKTALKKFLVLVVLRPLAPASGATSVPDRLTAAARTTSGGLFDEFIIDAAIGEDEAQPGRMRVFKKHGGKESLTEFRVLERFGRFAWIEARPITGRPQQVRVHLSAIGAPVLNDPLYGDPAERLLLSDLKRGYKGREAEKPLLGRLAVHASEIAIRHPLSRELLVLQAELPDDLEIALKNLRKYALGKG